MQDAKKRKRKKRKHLNVKLGFNIKPKVQRTEPMSDNDTAQNIGATSPSDSLPLENNDSQGQYFFLHESQMHMSTLFPMVLYVYILGVCIT